jgi:hypothetical protein
MFDPSGDGPHPTHGHLSLVQSPDVSEASEQGGFRLARRASVGMAVSRRYCPMEKLVRALKFIVGTGGGLS